MFTAEPNNYYQFQAVIRIPFAPWSGLLIPGNGVTAHPSQFDIEIDAEKLSRPFYEPLPFDLFTTGRRYSIQVDVADGSIDPFILNATLIDAHMKLGPWRLRFEPINSPFDYAMLTKNFLPPPQTAW